MQRIILEVYIRDGVALPTGLVTPEALAEFVGRSGPHADIIAYGTVDAAETVTAAESRNAANAAEWFASTESDPIVPGTPDLPEWGR